MPIKKTIYATDTTVERAVNSKSRGYFFAGYCYPVPSQIDDYYVLDEKLCRQISDQNLYTRRPILMEHNIMSPIGEILECKYERSHGPKGALYVKAWLNEGVFKSPEEVKSYKLSISYGVDRKKDKNGSVTKIIPLEISLTKNPEFPTEILVVHSNSMTMSEPTAPAAGESQPTQNTQAPAPQTSQTPAPQTSQTPTPQAPDAAKQPMSTFAVLEQIAAERPEELMEYVNRDPKGSVLKELIQTGADTSKRYSEVAEENRKLSAMLEEFKTQQAQMRRAEIQKSTQENLGEYINEEQQKELVEFFVSNPQHSSLSDIIAAGINNAKSKAQKTRPTRSFQEMWEDYNKTQPQASQTQQMLAAFGHPPAENGASSTTIAHSSTGKRDREPVPSEFSVAPKLYKSGATSDISQSAPLKTSASDLLEGTFKMISFQLNGKV